jgi:hypothetical protein
MAQKSHFAVEEVLRVRVSSIVKACKFRIDGFAASAQLLGPEIRIYQSGRTLPYPSNHGRMFINVSLEVTHSREEARPVVCTCQTTCVLSLLSG